MRVACSVLLLLASTLCSAQAPTPASKDSQAVAVIYYWKAKPGKLEEYSRYVREVAERIDHDAQRHGAFLSIATFVSQDPNSPWTHMRMFTLPDHAPAEALKAELDAATARVVPDEAKRAANSAYAATLRDAAGSQEVVLLSPRQLPVCGAD